MKPNTQVAYVVARFLHHRNFFCLVSGQSLAVSSQNHPLPHSQLTHSSGWWQVPCKQTRLYKRSFITFAIQPPSLARHAAHSFYANILLFSDFKSKSPKTEITNPYAEKHSERSQSDAYNSNPAANFLDKSGICNFCNRNLRPLLYSVDIKPTLRW